MSEPVTATIIVGAPVSEVYRIWANFENFPHFMKYITSVRKTGARTSHWVMEGPLKTQIEWDAETTIDEPGTRIGWNSRDSGDIKTSGQATFTSLGTDQTQVTVTLLYVVPGGKIGQAVAHLFDKPEEKLRDDLQRFKAYAESRERQQERLGEREAAG